MELRTMIKRWKLKEGSLSMEVLEHPMTLAGVPGKTVVFANAGNCSFCNIDGYQDTVFAWIADPGARPRLVPIAFSTEDFIRLLYCIGSPELAARAGQMSQGEYSLRRSNIGEAPSPFWTPVFSHRYRQLWQSETDKEYRKTPSGISRRCFWRSERDLNPRVAFDHLLP